MGCGYTCVDGLVAGEVALVTKGSLAAVTLVGFVAVGLQCVPLEGSLLREAAVTLIAEEGPVLCGMEQEMPLSEGRVAWKSLSPLELLHHPLPN